VDWPTRSPVRARSSTAGRSIIASRKVDHPKSTNVEEEDASGTTAWVGLWQNSAEDTRRAPKQASDGFKCLTNAPDVKSIFDIRAGRITTESKALFSDTPRTELVGTVAANTIQGYFMRRLQPSFALGVGAGVLWFSGDQLEGRPVRFIFTPVSVAFTPLALFLSKAHATQAGFLAIRFEEIAVVGSLRASDFNKNSTSSFETGSDLVRSVSVTVDVTTLLH
jgi:hypothetical protein